MYFLVDLISSEQHVDRRVESNYLRCFEIYCDFRRLFKKLGKISWLCTVEDFSSDLSVKLTNVSKACLRKACQKPIFDLFGAGLGKRRNLAGVADLH